MTTLRCVVAADPARLLVRATEGLFPLAPSTAQNPWPTLPAWMVLRQGGLRDDLHALAASAGVPGWFDPPVCLFAELSSCWSNSDAASLSAQERAALLSALLAKHGRGVFGERGDSWTPAVDRFIGDLIGEGVTAGALSAALGARTGHDDFERERDSVLSDVYTEWLSELARLGRTDGRDARVRLAAAIGADTAFAERLGHRRDIRIVGLADLRGGWSHLLHALAASPAVDSVTVFASHALEFPESLPCAIEIDEGRCGRPTARELFIEAPDSAREVEIVATRVRALLDDGVLPHRIAVIARQARPLVDMLSDSLTTLGVPVTARRRVALAHTGPARALRALLSVPIEGWSRHVVVELADNPLLALSLDAAVLDFVGMESPLSSCEEWTAALERLRDRAVAREGANSDERDHERRRALPASARIITTLDAWHTLAASARWLDGEHKPAEWLAWTHGVVTRSAWGIVARLAEAPAGHGYVQRTDCKARDRIETLVQDWMRALETFGVPADAPVDAERFLVQLGTALNEDLILQPETGFGVVVAEALAAGWRSFEHVFVVGLTSGEFPRRMPVSALLSDSDRDAMISAGLPLDPRSAWKSRERELFRVLCAAPTQSLVLSWPAMDADGREVVRSSFVESRIEAAAL
ncbi:MAG TPA: hypothetical protein VE869_01335, partial [Gemmatimonas sp.]|nr:hypothetical protein [Gemmatimonas sp.]